MPYIGKDLRKHVDPHINKMLILNVGMLNYIITRLCHRFIGTEKRYEKYNAVLGVLEAAKLEIYRKIISSYEDKKEKENGPI